MILARFQRIESLLKLARSIANRALALAQEAEPFIPQTFFFPNLPNDASVNVVGLIDVSQNLTYYVKETIVGRNAAGNVITATRRITVQGGAVPIDLADTNDAGSVSTMPGGVVTFSSAIVGTNLALRASNSALATSTPNITIYAEVFTGT